VVKIDKLFDQHEFIYLFFIEQDKDTTGINKSGHAEAILLETLLTDGLQPSSLSLDFFLNIKKETSKIKQELLDQNHELNIDRVVHDFDYYINKIRILFSAKNFIRLDKKSFLGLIEVIKANSTFILLEIKASKSPTSDSVRHIKLAKPDYLQDPDTYFSLVRLIERNLDGNSLPILNPKEAFGRNSVYFNL